MHFSVNIKPRMCQMAFAHLEFNHVACVNKALHLDESELGGYRLTVEKEKPQREN
ncbi:hypothetical protein DEO72_LG11g1175 [Vigna unguiculata]|uniref:Uncharacterized protein n=1 Tax=Vigna unguiculata TaxID=3917 RepID=A0A4D6NQW5_VIGUN|nr:hypothetical protein DEO72_LG11g1175 [Vigna unguiculata]